MNTITPYFNNEKTITIVFSPDNNYVKYFSVALKSLIDNANKNYFYHIILFEKDISERNVIILKQMLPKNFHIDFINISEHIKTFLPKTNLYSKKYWSESMFYRILIPAILPKFEKVLYIDSDVCILSDLVELFETDFEDKSLLAVQDSASPVIYHMKSRYIHMTTILKLRNPLMYFNSGVILFNVNKIKSDLDSYLKDLTNALKNNNLLYPDQDLLNIIFENKVKIISGKWNCMYDTWVCHNNQYSKWLSTNDYDIYMKNKKNPSILHYTSSHKPWIYPENEKAEIFWQYARKSPFYEEILYENLKKQLLNLCKKETTSIIKNITYRHKNYAEYLKCKILQIFTFGKTKKHYISKSAKLNKQIQDTKRIIKLSQT